MLRVFVLVAVGLLVAASEAAAPAAPELPRRTVTVMTRNLYLGTNLDAIVKATSAADAFRAVEAGWAQVQTNDFPRRARSIAAEIAAAKPDFVGFQEAVLYRAQSPSDFQGTLARNAVLDYVAELRTALRERGLRYRFVGVRTATDAELPSGQPPTMDIRLTVRDALLVRRDAALRIRRVRTGLYRTTYPLFGGLVTARRGWISADATLGGKPFRVVTTHLESFDDATQEEQGRELVQGPARTRQPLVLLGDLNSRADRTGTTTYANLLAAGFRDAWMQARPADPGLTCCHDDDLREAGAPFYSRIDYVLARGGLRAVRGQVVGEDARDRRAGLWPSDHAGVWITLRLP